MVVGTTARLVIDAPFRKNSKTDLYFNTSRGLELS
jgi:hypothetical protein